jgi:hypothetical protein
VHVLATGASCFAPSPSPSPPPSLPTYVSRRAGMSIYRQARDTAYMYGLFDRGTLEVGKRADINIVDLDTLAILEPVHRHDLPTGAPRWDQAVRGYEYTLLKGEVTFVNGVHTGALPGGLVRNSGCGVPTLKTGGALPGPPGWASNAARVAQWGAAEATGGGDGDASQQQQGSTAAAAAALQASLDSGSASSQSRVADALEASQRSKL